MKTNNINNLSPPKVISQLYLGDVSHHQNTNFLCQRTIKNEYAWRTNFELKSRSVMLPALFRLGEENTLKPHSKVLVIVLFFSFGIA